MSSCKCSRMLHLSSSGGHLVDESEEFHSLCKSIDIEHSQSSLSKPSSCAFDQAENSGIDLLFYLLGIS